MKALNDRMKKTQSTSGSRLEPIETHQSSSIIQEENPSVVVNKTDSSELVPETIKEELNPSFVDTEQQQRQQSSTSS